MNRMWFVGLGICALGFAGLGCSGNQKLASYRQDALELQAQVSDLDQQLADARSRSAELEARLRQAAADWEDREIKFRKEVEGQSIITLPEAALFDSGSAKLSPSGQEILGRIGDALHKYGDGEIRVEGHTDNVPIASRYQTKYRSNWELSSARAHAVLHFLRERHQIAPARLAAVGYGEYRPVGDNATESGRKANRRVVISLSPSVRTSASSSVEALGSSASRQP